MVGTVLFGEERREEWDAFIASSAYGHTLQSWAWGRARERTGWACVRLGVVEGEDLLGAAQVLFRTLPYGLGRIGYVPRGPAVDYRDKERVQQMIAGLRELAAGNGAIALKIEPEVLAADDTAEMLQREGLESAVPVQMRSSIWVDITRREDELLASFKQKTRYNIRLAAKKGVTIQCGSLDDVDSWYGLYEETSERDHFVIRPLAYYRTVLEELMGVDEANLLLAYHEGELLAGIVVFAFGSGAQYMYGASGNRKRNLMAPYLLQWEGMRWAQKRGARKYDLWGIPDRLEEIEDLWGVYRHKRGYNGEIVSYVGAFDLVVSPGKHFLLERLARPLFRRITRV